MMDQVDDSEDQVDDKYGEENEVVRRVVASMVLETLRGGITHA
jgi:hypothetical protein